MVSPMSPSMPQTFQLTSLKQIDFQHLSPDTSTERQRPPFVRVPSSVYQFTTRFTDIVLRALRRINIISGAVTINNLQKFATQSTSSKLSLLARLLLSIGSWDQASLACLSSTVVCGPAMYVEQSFPRLRHLRATFRFQYWCEQEESGRKERAIFPLMWTMASTYDRQHRLSSHRSFDVGSLLSC